MKQKYSLRSNMENAFKSYLSNTKNQIESELSSFIQSLSELTLQPQIAYSLLSEGKRLRPLLVILSAESVGGNRNEVMPLALAFELMHTATLVHDDIIDQDEMRRSKPAVHKKWSVNDAILTGDALIALSVDLASKYGENILKTVAQSALKLCDGEHIDVASSIETMTEKAYFKKISDKSASLFKASTYCGTSAAGGNPAEVRALSIFGENFGVAYQLRDDLMDLTPSKGNMALKDLKGRRITLPLIRLYFSSSPEGKKQIETLLRTLVSEDLGTSETAETLLKLMNEKGAIDYCEEKIDEHLQRAISSISMLKDTEYKDYLIEMTKALRAWG